MIDVWLDLGVVTSPTQTDVRENNSSKYCSMTLAMHEPLLIIPEKKSRCAINGKKISRSNNSRGFFLCLFTKKKHSAANTTTAFVYDSLSRTRSLAFFSFNNDGRVNNFFSAVKLNNKNVSLSLFLLRWEWNGPRHRNRFAIIMHNALWEKCKIQMFEIFCFRCFCHARGWEALLNI